ncbi:MAG: tetratricopeptide repeat protein [Myxococcota bacterium]
MEPVEPIAPCVISLDGMYAEDWFEELGHSSPGFDQLCELIGEKFVAFSILTGVHVTSLTVDRQQPEASRVDFRIGESRDEHRLSLGEFRRRLAASLLSDEEFLTELSDPSDPGQLQAYIGYRYVLLAPVFGMHLHYLVFPAGGAEARLGMDVDSVDGDVSLSEFREMIRDQVRSELDDSSSGSSFAIDLDAIPPAERAAAEEDWDRVIDCLGAWPGPLSLLLRTSDGQSLSVDVRRLLAGALGLLGTAYARTARFDWAEEVMRLGIQWSQDDVVSGDLFQRLADANARSGRHGQAIGLFRRALSLGAPPAVVLPGLARCYAVRGKAVAAIVCAEEAFEAGVEDAELTSELSAWKATLGSSWDRFRQLVPAGAAPVGAVSNGAASDSVHGAASDSVPPDSVPPTCGT